MRRGLASSLGRTGRLFGLDRKRALHPGREVAREGADVFIVARLFRCGESHRVGFAAGHETGVGGGYTGESRTFGDRFYPLYRRIFENMGGRSVTLRTLDIGGDKQLPYFDMPKELNPALGWRGIRVALQWKDLLRVQLRAALRASAHGRLKLLLPMITTLDEVLEVREMVRELRIQLLEQGYEVAEDVPLGIMIEVPAAVYLSEQFSQHVDFLSVGSNDLTQYLLAVDRNNPNVE